MEITTAEKISTQNLYTLFSQSFSDYFVPFSLTYEAFAIRIYEKLNIDLKNSYIIWNNERAVGFILQSTVKKKGEKIGYNAGTGILTPYRNGGLATRLISHAKDQSIKQSVSRMILEVIKENHSAFHLYQKCGFEVTRELLSYKLFQRVPVDLGLDIRESEIKSESRSHLWDFEPSTQDLDTQLVYNHRNERLLEAYIQESLVGYIIFQPHNGRISQVAVHPQFRQKGIGKALVGYAQWRSQNKELTLMNIPADQYDTHTALLAMGFRNQISQLEMEWVV